MDAAHSSSTTFGKVAVFIFLMKWLSFLTIYLMITPLFGLEIVLGLYSMVDYCCIVVCWEPDVIWDPMTVFLGCGGGGGDLRLNYSPTILWISI